MHALYKWLDLNDPDGNPSNGKVLSTLTMLLAWVLLFAWVARHDFSSGGLGSDFVIALSVVVSIPFGADSFKAVQKMRKGE